MALINTSQNLPTYGVWNNIVIQMPNNPDIPESGFNINGYVSRFEDNTGTVVEHVTSMTEFGTACALNTTGEYPDLSIGIRGAYFDTFYTLFLNSRGVYFDLLVTYYSTGDLGGSTKVCKYSNCKFAGRQTSAEANSPNGDVNITIKYIQAVWLT